MQVEEAIYSRRSIRRYSPRDVPDELVLKLIDAARQAPSSKNSQPWEFIIVRDQEVKEKLAQLAPYGRFIAQAPVVVAVVTDPEKSRFHMVDGALAVHNLTLAAWALGLGTCWVGTMDREKAKEILEIPEGKHLLTVLPIGYPAEQPQPRPRKPIEEITYLEKYGRKLPKHHGDST